MEPIKATKIASAHGAWWIEHPRRLRPTGRVCRNRGCDTVLSIYNRQEWCSVHARDYDHATQRYRNA
jgi:hypothetical protein